jgi:hypothetical protein
VFFGYMAKGEATRDIAYYEADAAGRIVHTAWFEASAQLTRWTIDTSAPPGVDTANGEGYVMQLVDRHETGTTDLLILDAQRIDEPPVATLRLPVRTPGGLHGPHPGGLRAQRVRDVPGGPLRPGRAAGERAAAVAGDDHAAVPLPSPGHRQGVRPRHVGLVPRRVTAASPSAAGATIRKALGGARIRSG